MFEQIDCDRVRLKIENPLLSSIVSKSWSELISVLDDWFDWPISNSSEYSDEIKNRIRLSLYRGLRMPERLRSNSTSVTHFIWTFYERLSVRLFWGKIIDMEWYKPDIIVNTGWTEMFFEVKASNIRNWIVVMLEQLRNITVNFDNVFYIFYFYNYCNPRKLLTDKWPDALREKLKDISSITIIPWSLLVRFIKDTHLTVQRKKDIWWLEREFIKITNNSLEKYLSILESGWFEVNRSWIVRYIWVDMHLMDGLFIAL